MSRRCSECRARFEPAVTAKEKQRVCGAECRRRRRARLARRRRRAELEGSRAEERERQRQHRQGRRVLQAPPLQACRGSPEPECASGNREACHEPASVHKHVNLQEEMLKIVDRSLRVSRASFERERARMRRELSRVSASRALGSGQSPGPG